MLGKLPAGSTKFDYSVSGKAGGQDRRFTASEAVPTPDNANYFLVNVAGQWQSAKDRPALLPADRTLASAATQLDLAREDLLAKAYWALQEEQVDASFKLFQQTLKLDPHSVEAEAGLDIVAKIRDGKLTKEQLFQELKQHEHKPGAKAPADRQGKADGGDQGVLVAMANPLRLDPRTVDAPNDPLAVNKARIEVANQQARLLVDQAIRQAEARVLARPADAIADLKQTLDDVRSNPDITDAMRVQLVDRLQRASQSVDRTARLVLADQERNQQAAADAAARVQADTAEHLTQLQTRERMRTFADLMHLAREESAYLQAQSIAEDLTAQGHVVPPSVVAGYVSGLRGFNLRENQRLRQLRNERWLATLLSVEESAVPFPDEPPIRFPDSAYIKMVTKLRYGASGSQFDNWKDFSEYRLNVKRYASSTFGAPEDIGRALDYQKKLNERIPKYELLVQTTLDKAIFELLSHQANIPVTYNDAAFVHAMQDKDLIKKTEIDKIEPMIDVTRATVLKVLLSKAGGEGTGVPTYLIRPDSLEITTTEAAVADKVVRVYPVADLVTPIGNQLPAGGVFGVVGQPNQLGGSAARAA